MKHYKSKVKVTPYASEELLLVLGKVELVLKNLNNCKMKSMAYVIKGVMDTFLGRRNGELLGVIVIISKGSVPDGQGGQA